MKRICYTTYLHLIAFILTIFLPITLIAFLITSCSERAIYVEEGIDAIAVDEFQDSEVYPLLPNNICPDKYKENNPVVFPHPKISFGTDARIEIKRPDVYIQNSSDIEEFFDQFAKFFNKAIDEEQSQLTKIDIITFPTIEGISKRCRLDLKSKEGAYYLKIAKTESGARIYIVSDEREGFYNAAKSIAHMIYKNTMYETAIYDYPDVRIRGVAEAFYGKPWDKVDRLDVIYFLAMLKYNMFLYSPKSDPYAWAMWRTPFDSEEEEKLRELAEHTKRLGIIPCYGVGPGYDIAFSNNKDYTILLNKYRKLISFGFDKCLVLAFDDTQKSLSDADRGQFKDISEAQVYLAKRLYEDIKKIKNDILLAFVPNDYTTKWAKGDIYLQKIASGLKGLYEIAWTGYEVVSPTITKYDLDEIEAITHFTPILADNYPVCDIMFGGGAAFLGPITGRDADIFERIQMYASNPMRYAISNIIPLGTIADMLWTPKDYDSEGSFLNSIRFFAKDGREKDIYEFATNLRSSLISDKESPELKEEIENLFKEEENCESRHYETLKELFFDRFISMEQILKGASDDRFIKEMQPWLNKLRDYGTIGNKALYLLRKKCRGETIPQQDKIWFEQMFSIIISDKYRICGEIMNDFILRVYERIKE